MTAQAPQAVAPKNGSAPGQADAPEPVAAPAPKPVAPPFDTAEMGAIAHLYRGEVYRSTIWRTRLDNTTNWSIVTMGIALSSTFSSPDASSLPLILVGMLMTVFLTFEARRYRYFNVWRARARWMEVNFYAPILLGQPGRADWREVMARDYLRPAHHISFLRALQRRLRRTYVWILGIQSAAYWGKLAIHPVPAQTLSDFVSRAEIGPIPGWAVLGAGLLYTFGWIGFAVGGYVQDHRKHGGRERGSGMG